MFCVFPRYDCVIVSTSAVDCLKDSCHVSSGYTLHTSSLDHFRILVDQMIQFTESILHHCASLNRNDLNDIANSEIRRSNPTVGSCLSRDHNTALDTDCAVRSLYYSYFYPQWDGNISISFRVQY